VAFGTGALALAPGAGCSSSSTTFPNGGETNIAPPYGTVPFDADVQPPDDASFVLADAHVGQRDAQGDAADGSASDAGSDAPVDAAVVDGESDASDAGQGD
jgi:hypothetical protein